MYGERYKYEASCKHMCIYMHNIVLSHIFFASKFIACNMYLHMHSIINILSTILHSVPYTQ